MRRNPFLLAAAMAMVAPLAGSIPSTAPVVSSASSGSSQSKGALLSEKVSKRSIKAQLSYNQMFASVGGRHPWVNKHGYMLRQVGRNMPRGAR